MREGVVGGRVGLWGRTVTHKMRGGWREVGGRFAHGWGNFFGIVWNEKGKGGGGRT